MQMPPPSPAASAAPAAAAPPPPAGALPTAAAAAVAAGKRSSAAASSSKIGPRSLQDRLQPDAMAAHAASFLPGAELGRLALCASYWQGLLLGAGSRWLWQEALQHEDNGPTLLRRLEHTAPPPPPRQPAAGKQQQQQQQQQQQGPSTRALAAACGQAHRLSHLAKNSPMRWSEVPAGLAGTGGRWPVRAMEGHAATLLDDRWMVMVGGFGMRGVENEVYVLDTWALEAGEEEGEAAPAAWWRLAERGQRPNPPVYGHVACALGPRRLAVFGGCTMGGYAGVTNDLFILDLELDGNGPLLSQGGEGVGDGRPRLGGVVTWRRAQALGQSLTSRAYCTLTPLPDPSDGGVRRLLVLGGIREGRAMLDMEVVEFKGDDDEDGTPMVEVVKPAVDGPVPPVRMGHSCTLLPLSPESSDKEARCRWRLVVLGGSDGSDLLRNGEERDDVWLLDVSLLDDNKGAGHPRFAWSQPPLPRPAPWSFPMGRTHTAHYVGGGVILCFGGGAGLSNRLGLLDTNEWTFGSPRLLRSSRGSEERHRAPLVRPRLSHVAVCAGTKVLVHGGWNGRELGDLLALDLVPPMSSLPLPAAAAAAAAGAGRRGEQEDEVEKESEDEDEEGGGHGSRRRAPQPRIECAQS